MARGPVPRDRGVNRDLSACAWREGLSLAIVALTEPCLRASMAGDRPPPYVHRNRSVYPWREGLSLAIVVLTALCPRASMAGDRPPPHVPKVLFICHTMNVVGQLTKRNPHRCQVLLTHELLRRPDVCLLSILLALRRNLRHPVSI